MTTDSTPDQQNTITWRDYAARFGRRAGGVMAFAQDCMKSPRLAFESRPWLLETIVPNPLTWPIQPFVIGKFIFETGFTFKETDTQKGSEKGPNLQPPDAYGLNGFTEQSLSVGGGKVTAWYHPATKKDFPTFMYCHGSAGSLDMRKGILQAVADRGFGVMAAAYPGYKGSGYPNRLLGGVKPSIEGCIDTAVAMTNALAGEGIPPEKMVFFGESLGGAVALDATARLQENKRPAATICFGAFSQLDRRVKDNYNIPTDLVLRARLDGEAAIKKIDDSAILLIHGTNDKVTKPYHSERLREASKQNKTGGRNTALYLLPGVNHHLTKVAEDATVHIPTWSDPEEINKVLDLVHDRLIAKGVCPDPFWHRAHDSAPGVGAP